MTELERARAHLMDCQRRLSNDRRCNYSWVPHSELLVLAALSWVWEEQERAKRIASDEWEAKLTEWAGKPINGLRLAPRQFDHAIT